MAARGPGRFRVHPRRARRTLGVLRAFVKSKAATPCYRRSDAMLRTVGRHKPRRRADAADWKRITEPSPRRESFSRRQAAQTPLISWWSRHRRANRRANGPSGHRRDPKALCTSPGTSPGTSPDTNWSRRDGPLSAAAAANTSDPGDVNDDVTAAGHQAGSITPGSITQGSMGRERTVRGQLDASLAAEGAELVDPAGRHTAGRSPAPVTSTAPSVRLPRRRIR